MATTLSFHGRMDDMRYSGLPCSSKKRKTTIAGFSLCSPRGELASRLLHPYEKRMKSLTGNVGSPSCHRAGSRLELPFAARSSGEGNGSSLDPGSRSRSSQTVVQPYAISTSALSFSVLGKQLDYDSVGRDTVNEEDKEIAIQKDKKRFQRWLDEYQEWNLGVAKSVRKDTVNEKDKEIARLEGVLKSVEQTERSLGEDLKALKTFEEFVKKLRDSHSTNRSDLSKADMRNPGEHSKSISDVEVALSGGASLRNEETIKNTDNAQVDSRQLWKRLHDQANHPSRKAILESNKKQIECTVRQLSELQITRRKTSSEKKSEVEDDKTLTDAFTLLSSDDEDAVTVALDVDGIADRHEVLTMHTKSNIDITRAVIQCLRPSTWLNDEVINVYMELLKERELQEPKRFLKCHFFNTFFYNKLFKDKRSYDYKAIRRWTTQKKLGYSLSECDKILVPIHQDIHWCLAVINIRDERLEYLDSLKGSDSTVLKVLGRYIVDEAKDKDDKVLDVSSWKHYFPKDIPEQLNGCDCGMFMVKYADFHSRGAPLSFTQENMEYFRKKMVLEILKLKAT